MSKEQRDLAIGIPLERVISSEGEGSTLYGLHYTSPRARQELIRTMEEMGKVVEERSGDGRGSFAITNWDNCKWNPKGPKPIYAQPENPSKN